MPEADTPTKSKVHLWVNCPICRRSVYVRARFKLDGTYDVAATGALAASKCSAATKPANPQ
jgi:hypothetical protein